MLRRAAFSLVALLCGTVAVVSAQEPVLLKYKFQKGEKLKYKTTMSMKQKQSIAGMELNTTMTQEVIRSDIVDEVGSDGQVVFKTKTEQMKAKMSISPVGGEFEFDSTTNARDTSTEIGAAITPIFERLVGSEYEVKITPAGKVSEVKGYAELLGDLLKDNPYAATFGAGGTDNKSAQHNEQDAFIELPAKAVKPGDTWEVAREYEMGKLGKFKLKTTYTLEGADKVGNVKTVRIATSTEGSIELDLEQAGAKVMGTMTVAGSSGTVQFDPIAGRALLIKDTVKSTGNLNISAGGMNFNVPIEQEHLQSRELLLK
jgi:hypothetical protein